MGKMFLEKCTECGTEYYAKKTVHGNHYCSERCKQGAYRKRRKQKIASEYRMIEMDDYVLLERIKSEMPDVYELLMDIWDSGNKVAFLLQLKTVALVKGWIGKWWAVKGE
jgi:endogenous inhibitor of DNA gyrase (YacG/DUF329 family)